MACLSNGAFFKGCQKFYCHSNCEIYTVYRDEKLAVPYISADEGWKADFLCPHGDAGYYVSGKDSVGTNTIIGYNTTILAHEYLIQEYRIGKVLIGDEVMIGANTTILPGVEIGDGAVVSAGTLVHKDVPAGAFVGGNPMRIIYTKEEMQERLKKPAE